LLELAFDEVRASVAAGGDVGDARDAVDPLSVEDSLAAGGLVAASSTRSPTCGALGFACGAAYLFMRIGSTSPRLATCGYSD